MTNRSPPGAPPQDTRTTIIPTRAAGGPGDRAGAGGAQATSPVLLGLLYGGIGLLALAAAPSPS